MKERFKVGFDSGVNCVWLDDDINKGCYPIVDTNSPSYHGTCIALTMEKSDAERIVFALNLVEEMKSKLPPLGV